MRQEEHGEREGKAGKNKASVRQGEQNVDTSATVIQSRGIAHAYCSGSS